MPTKAREKFKTMHNVFDNFTNRTLFKLITEGHFEGLESPISIGKEANVFSAHTKTGRVAVKIYRLEACDFNKMHEYIKEDPRYIDLKGKKRKIIFAWAQREFRNLLKAREAQVRVPTPIKFMNNVLVLEYIGDEDVAPKLKDKHPKKPKEFLKKIIENMGKLNQVGLVHADLSPFNILNDNENPVLIDFSQATPRDNTRFDEFLDRDITNITLYFQKRGVDITNKSMKEQILNF